MVNITFKEFMNIYDIKKDNYKESLRDAIERICDEESWTIWHYNECINLYKQILKKNKEKDLIIFNKYLDTVNYTKLECINELLSRLGYKSQNSIKNAIEICRKIYIHCDDIEDKLYDRIYNTKQELLDTIKNIGYKKIIYYKKQPYTKLFIHHFYFNKKN